MSDITDDQIRILMTQAAEAGDIHMAAIAAKAIGASYADHDLDATERAHVDGTTVDQCRNRCVRVIREARHE